MAENISEKDIELEIKEDNVVIKKDNAESKFYKEIELPCIIDTESEKINLS